MRYVGCGSGVQAVSLHGDAPWEQGCSDLLWVGGTWEAGVGWRGVGSSCRDKGPGEQL